MMNRTGAISFLFILFSAFSTSAQTGWQWATGSHCYMTANSGTGGWTITADKFGNVFGGANIGAAVDSVAFGGITISNPAHFPQMAIVKADAGGNYQWVIPSQGTTVGVLGITTDTTGNIYALVFYYLPGCTVGGVALSSIDTVTYAVVKVSPTGSVLWAKNIAPQGAHGITIGSIGIDAAQNIYVSGVFDAPSISIGATVMYDSASTADDLYNAFVAKFDVNCDPVWAKSINGRASVYLAGMAVSANGTVYVAGAFKDTIISGNVSIRDTSSNSSSFLFKYDSSGHVIWGKSSMQYNMNYGAIATDAADNVYLTAAFVGSTSLGPYTFTSPGGWNVLTASFDSSFSVQWAQAAYGTPLFRNVPHNICIDYCGNISIEGTLAADGTTVSGVYLSFGSDTLVHPYLSSEAFFLGIYDKMGNYKKSEVLPSGGGSLRHGATVDNRGNLYICSVSDRTMTVGGSTLVDTAGVQFFIAKYQYDDTGCSAETFAGVKPVATSKEITLFPNPANNECTIQSAAPFVAGASVTVYDVEGRSVMCVSVRSVNTSNNQGQTVHIDVSHLAPGLYICRIRPGDGSAVVKKLLVER